MKNPKISTKVLRAIEVHGIRTDVFRRILKSLRASPTPQEIEKGEGDNYGGWVLPFSGGDESPEKDAEGYVVIFPSCIECGKTRKLISKSLNLKLEDYDVVSVHDCR